MGFSFVFVRMPLETLNFFGLLPKSWLKINMNPRSIRWMINLFGVHGIFVYVFVTIPPAALNFISVYYQKNYHKRRYYYEYPFLSSNIIHNIIYLLCSLSVNREIFSSIKGGLLVEMDYKCKSPFVEILLF